MSGSICRWLQCLRSLQSAAAIASAGTPTITTSGVQAPSDVVLVAWPSSKELVQAASAGTRITTPQLTAHAASAIEEHDFDSEVARGKASSVNVAGRVFSTIKVQFKYAMKMDDLVTGSEFDKPLNMNKMTAWGVTAVIKAAQRVLSPALNISAHVEKPYWYAPFMDMAERVFVSKEMPAGVADDIQHDTTLFDAGGRPMSYYRKAANRVDKSFTVGDWWTFVIEDKNDWAKNKLSFAKWVDLQALTGSQPFQYMLKDKSTDVYLYSSDLWNAGLASAYVARYCEL